MQDLFKFELLLICYVVLWTSVIWVLLGHCCIRELVAYYCLYVMWGMGKQQDMYMSRDARLVQVW